MAGESWRYRSSRVSTSSGNSGSVEDRCSSCEDERGF